MGMLLLELLLASTLAAQSLPDAPRPERPGRPFTLDQALAELKERPIPSFAQWQKERQKEALRAPAGGSAPAPGRLGLRRDSSDLERTFGVIRYNTEDLAIHVLQPAPGLKLGAFYANHDANYERREIYHDVQKGVRLTIQLGGDKKPEPVFHFPFTATYTETEVSGRRVIVHTDEFKGFQELKP